MRTFVDQPTQIFKSNTFNDTLPSGISLQTSSLNLENDLNSLRSQVRQILWAGDIGNWYDAISQISGNYGVFSSRGINSLGSDLNNLEQHRFLFRRQSSELVNVATGSNFALLSVSLGNAPSNYAVVDYESYATGTIIATSQYGIWSINQVSGSSVITPKNLVLIRDAWSHNTLTTSLGGKEIFGLLQVESGTITGDTFDDVNKRTQISFIYENNVNGTSSLDAVLSSDIGGKTIRYSYVTRTDLKDLPEDAYLSSDIFIDVPQPVSGNNIVLSDITLQRAVTNQGSTLVVDSTGTNIQLSAGSSWTFLSGTQQIWSLISNPTYTELIVSSTFTSFVTNQFNVRSGITIGTASINPISIGANTLGTINTTLNLILSAGTDLQFKDQYGTSSSSINFSNNILEWNRFGQYFNPGTSILGALNMLTSSINLVSGSLRRRRAQAGITATQFVNPGDNVTYPTNLDAPLLNYSGNDFTSDLNIYLNGILLIPGTSVINPNDVYPGIVSSTGDLKFPMKIRSGSIITMEVFTGT